MIKIRHLIIIHLSNKDAGEQAAQMLLITISICSHLAETQQGLTMMWFTVLALD